MIIDVYVRQARTQNHINLIPLIATINKYLLPMIRWTNNTNTNQFLGALLEKMVEMAQQSRNRFTVEMNLIVKANIIAAINSIRLI